MVSSVKIIYSGFITSATRNVHCSGVSVNLRKNNSQRPIDNGNNTAYVQTLSYDNNRYTIRGVITNLADTSSLQYADVLVLLKAKYSTDSPKLVVTYNSTTSLVGMDGTTVQIPVIFDTGNYDIDVSDSRDGYRPPMNLNFIETR